MKAEVGGGERMTEETVQVESTETAVQMNAQMGLRLRGAREKANMSLREMARRVHLSPSFISQVELGRTAPSVGRGRGSSGSTIS